MLKYCMGQSLTAISLGVSLTLWLQVAQGHAQAYTPCRDRCKTVEIVCEEPPAPAPVVPETAEKNTVQLEQSALPASNSSAFPCSGGMCVGRDDSGRCSLYLGYGSALRYLMTLRAQEPTVPATRSNQRPSDPLDFLACGLTVTPKQITDAVDALRPWALNYLNALKRQSSLIPRTHLARKDMVDFIVGLTMNSCTLRDEILHIVDRFNCLHHLACVEANSGSANVACYNHLLTRNTLNVLAGMFRELEEDIWTPFCERAFNAALYLGVEECICARTRDGSLHTPVEQGQLHYNNRCEQCAERMCAVDPLTSRSSKIANLRETCSRFVTAQTKQTTQKGCIDQYISSQALSHSCDAYLNWKRP